MTKRQEALLLRLEEWFDANEVGLPSVAANHLHIPLQAVEAVIKIGIHERRLVRLGERVVTERHIAALFLGLKCEFGDKVFHPRELREFLGYSRLWTDQLANVLEMRGELIRDEAGWRLDKGAEC